MKAAAGGASAIAAGTIWSPTARAAQSKGALDKVTLGNTGIETSRLGIGTGTKGNHRNGSAQTRLGEKEFLRLVHHAYDAGIRLFDVADFYTSHHYMKRFLAEIPRDDIVIQSKIWWRYEGESVLPTLRRFQRELGVDYLDTTLLHCVTEGTWPEDLERMRDDLEKAKADEIVKVHGASVHGYPPLQRFKGLDWVNTGLYRINHAQSHMDEAPDKVVTELDALHQAGKGVMGMKIFGEGDFKSAEQREASLKYVLDLDCVDCFIIGFEKPEEIDDAIATIDRIGKA